MRADAKLGYYADTGCEAHPQCVTCPFPQCLKDVAKEHLVSATERNRELYNYWKAGHSIEEVAETYGLKRKYTAAIITRLLEPAMAMAPRHPRNRNATRSVDVPVRVRAKKKISSTRKRDSDFHYRVVLLRTWGYSLKVIATATGLHHATIIHHLQGRCKCLGVA